MMVLKVMLKLLMEQMVLPDDEVWAQGGDCGGGSGGTDVCGGESGVVSREHLATLVKCMVIIMKLMVMFISYGDKKWR